MHVRIYCHLHRPDTAGGASVFTDFAEGLAARGHDVELMTAVPHYPDWANTSGVSLWHRHRDRIDGVDVVRHGFVIPKYPGRARWRAAGEASYTASLTRSVLWPPRRSGVPDVVVAFVPMLASAVAARLDARRHQVPLWINVQDLSGRAAAGYSSGLGSVLTTIEDRILASADLVTTIAPSMTDQLRSLSGPRLATFPNWLHSRAAEQFARRDELDHRGDRRRSVRLLYAGNIGRKQGLEKIVAFLAESSASFEFEVCGTGAGAEAVDLVFPTADDRFRRRPFLEESEFLDRLTWCDAFLVPERPSDGPSFLPSKLLPAIAAGAPILSVVGSDSALRNELETHRTGTALTWDELPQLIQTAEALRVAMRSEALPAILAARAREQSSSAALDRAEHLLATLTGAGPTTDDVLWPPVSRAPSRHKRVTAAERSG